MRAFRPGFQMWPLWLREHYGALGAAAFLSILYALIVSASGGQLEIAALFPLLAAFLLLLSHYWLAFFIVIASLFVDAHPWAFSPAVWCSFALGLAFLVRYHDVRWKEFENPLTLPILIYGVSIVPSLLNATRPLTSLFLLLNVVAFLIVLFVTVASVRSERSLRRVFMWFVGLVLINGLYQMFQLMTGVRRAFGFAGIMYVDYAGLGISVLVAVSLLARGRQRMVSFLLAIFLAASLVVTQTRSIWIASVLTLMILMSFLFFHPSLAGGSRRRILALGLVGALFLGGAGFAMIALNPRIEQRAAELTDKSRFDVGEAGQVGSSLVSRALIWDTALNAFKAHPIAGIGIYAFSYSSQEYYKVPRVLFDLYVAGVSPHQTHLSVLTETGLFGAAGFIFFVVSALRFAFRAIRLSQNERGRRYAVIGSVAVVYCTVSMFFTDAWLWGQGIVLLALVLGFMVANAKIDTAVQSA